MANYPIQDVEGIGPAYGEKLRGAGIENTDQLLAACKSPKHREALAEKAGVTAHQVLKWANMVDLYRVPGVGSEYAELLEAAGVDTVPELAQRNAANLTAAMSTLNEEKKLVRKVPVESQVEKWISEAKAMPRVLTY